MGSRLPVQEPLQVVCNHILGPFESSGATTGSVQSDIGVSSSSSGATTVQEPLQFRSHYSSGATTVQEPLQVVCNHIWGPFEISGATTGSVQS